MKTTLVVGLDVGTTSVKAAAYRDDGQPVAQASREYPTQYPQPGWADQRPVDWQTAIHATVRELADRLGGSASQIAAMGLSAHAPGLIPVDGRGQSLLEQIPIWQDSRTVEHATRLLEAIGPDWVGLGMPLASFPAKLLWFTETHPDLAGQAALAVGIKGYLVHWLTGRHATDPSSEPGNSHEWQAVCRACGWSLDRLPPVLGATDVVGELRPELAADLGLRDSMPVVIGLNDGACATLGTGALHPGEGAITLATNGVVYLVAAEPLPAQTRLQRALFCWPYIEGRWIVGGQTKSGAASLHWFHGLLEERSRPGSELEPLLIESADTPPGSHDVLFIPHLMGRGTPTDDPFVTGAFLGLRLHTRRADLTRAVLEGVAYTLREVLDALEQTGFVIHRLMITGGGSRSSLWRQITSDTLNRSLSYSQGDSCLGAAMLAAVGAGLFPNLEAALVAMLPSPQDTHPKPPAVAVYERKYHDYRRQRDALFASDAGGADSGARGHEQ